MSGARDSGLGAGRSSVNTRLAWTRLRSRGDQSSASDQLPSAESRVPSPESRAVRESVTCHPMRPRTLAAVGIVVVTAAAIERAVSAARTRGRRRSSRGWPACRARWPTRSSGSASPSRRTTCRCRREYGALRARLYVPARYRRAIVLVAGVNALGIDEPRLYGLAHELASVGFAVLTPELPDLQRYDITPRTTDMIEDARRLAVEPAAARARRPCGPGRHQFRRRSVDRRRGPARAARPRGVRLLVRRPRQLPAGAALPLLGVGAGAARPRADGAARPRRASPPPARLRRRHRPARRRGPRGAARSGGTAARRHPHVPARPRTTT